MIFYWDKVYFLSPKVKKECCFVQHYKRCSVFAFAGSRAVCLNHNQLSKLRSA